MDGLLGLQGARAVIGVFFQAKGIDGQRGYTTTARATQHPVARGVVGIILAVAPTDAPLDQVIQAVVGQGRQLPLIGAAGGVPPGTMRTLVELPTFIRAGGSGAKDA